MKPKIDYFSSDSLRHDLKGKTVRAGAWTAGSQALMMLLQFAAIPVLARLLDPADFGLVAMVTVFTGFASMFVDSGMSLATIQREQITHQQVSNLFWLSAGLGFLIALILAAISPIVAMFYGEPRLMPIMLALAAGPAFGGLRIQHMALLRRALLQERMVIVGIVSMILSYAVAITIAAVYHSYWALVVLPLSNALFGMLTAWAVSGWLPSLPRRGAGVRSMVGFGANVASFNFINYFTRSGDNLLIGWWWGAETLGLYERAYGLMMAPQRQLNAPLQSVMIPALSRLTGEPERYRDAYSRAVGILQVASCPAIAFAAIMAYPIINLVLGPDFEDAAPILRWLAIAGVAQPISISLGWLLISQGRSNELIQWGLIASPLIVLSFVIGLPWGAVAVAQSYAVMYNFVIIPLAIWKIGSNGPVRQTHLVRLYGEAILWALAIALAAFLGAMVAPADNVLQLIAGGLSSAIVMLLGLWLTPAGRGSVEVGADLINRVFNYRLRA